LISPWIRATASLTTPAADGPTTTRDGRRYPNVYEHCLRDSFVNLKYISFHKYFSINIIFKHAQIFV
jgi:hypothetical protein